MGKRKKGGGYRTTSRVITLCCIMGRDIVDTHCLKLFKTSPGTPSPSLFVCDCCCCRKWIIINA